MDGRVGFRAKRAESATNTPNNLNYDNDNSIGWTNLPRASYKRLKSMYRVVHVPVLGLKNKVLTLITNIAVMSSKHVKHSAWFGILMFASHN